MYSWHGHGPNHHAAANAATTTPGRRLESPNPSSHSSYPMSQLRWMSRPHNAPPGALPTLSSNLRMGATAAPGGGAAAVGGGTTAGGKAIAGPGPRTNTPQHAPGVALVVESRVSAESIESSDSDQSDVASGGRDVVGADALGDTDYVPSHGDVQESRRGGEGGAGGATTTGGAVMGSAGRNSIMDRVLGDDDMDSSGMAGDTPRKHGKRLTTLEEVSLFNICNRHAEEFGQRSNLCKWWMTVTAEFTRDQGHPYSWHSVRRKVELVTKQRMKFLEEQREKGGSENEDLSNPRWRSAVDAWIPTWQRWEEAEARRIEKRDSRRSRKRKERSWEPAWDAPSSNGWRQTSSPAVDNTAISGNQSQGPLPPPPAPAPTAPAPVTSNLVRLPPGFENMFANQPSNSPGWSSQHPASTSALPSAGENGMMSAVIETLGKLNKHLDAVSSEPQSSPLIASLASNLESQRRARLLSQEEVTPDEGERQEKALPASTISQLKEELRQELRDEIRSELEKDRAALEEKLDSVQRTQEMILEMLRQEPA
ncbi:hypothetical protein F9C07_4082 [Aspergillus flavus]|uniref:Uncharacterized protein n=4 Tax=Aspergillus subgen. Circumdati TaxID=2720871 RepID=B8N7H5_ASPFN|nr:uncharacterized protein G4B84_006718 [Aspergillus flavus NRRL3357]EIT80359.1 hypothetical protein Ao3042_03194 [Aspergillus oryzae 3.042]KAB8245953.1 hypothetical protein BDV35DRAFT_236918 [Aspergillus flavus]KDE77054.1 hypothetical protein AO1008_03104 [Aspergillus oryzae 100-8]KJJ28989.1 hypothetical protein AFLA70_111g002290 [Aspergillus flavus AF70]OOO11609.1 hypothetical protein OAory_01080790 [Aspergillus oryzae]|eukprot:EIT80359.1 hypothetical protein Ao3042_03194 [Aspergillus oryzae 3.042]